MFAQLQQNLNKFISGDAPQASSSSQYDREKRSLVQHANDFSSEDDDDTILPMAFPSESHQQEQQSVLPQQVTSFFSTLSNTVQSNIASFRENIASTTPQQPQPPLPEQEQQQKSTTIQIDTTSTWGDSFSSWKDGAKNRLGSIIGTQEEVPPEPKTWLESLTSSVDDYTTMSKTTRIYGFGISAGLGLVFLLIAIGFLPSILIASRAFAFFYTIGNICLVISTFFVVGPMKQLSLMIEKDRIIPSICFVSSLLLTMFSAIVLKSALLVILLIVVQVVSLGYYILSYIPFGQQIASSFISALMTAFRAMF